MNLFAQNISSSRWSDLFSYNNVLAIREDNGKLIAATENGIFFYTPTTGEIKKLSKANGLHEVKISAFDYNPVSKIGLVGYKNGSMDVITPEGIIYVVDIPIATGYMGDKKINHISITDSLAVISVGYGVSIFNLDKKEFGDSAFFLNNGSYEASKEAVIKDGFVYSVTATGLKKHEINVTFPIYTTWDNISSGNFTQIANGDLIAYSNANQVFLETGSTFLPLSQSFTTIQDIVITPQNIIVTDVSQVYVFDLTGNPIKSFKSLVANEKLNTAYYTNSQIYFGSKLSGIINEKGDVLKPDGPYNNTSYRINLVNNQIAISTGGRTDYNTPNYNNLGYYHFDGAKWNYPEFFKTFSGNLNVLDAVINPAKPNEIFFVNFTFVDNNMGIYRMKNNEFVKNYETVGTFYNRFGGLTFDTNNQLFVSSEKRDAMIGFHLYNPTADAFTLVNVVSGASVQKPLANSGILYIPAPRTNGGLLIYDYNNTATNVSDDRFKILKKSNNLPTERVVSTAVDKNGDVWIGTQSGLRILQNPSVAIDEDNPQTEPIIIEENGTGEELFRDSHILQIEVDRGNQKWISVDEGGVFYLSSNGERTINQFNRANSPLPTNNVTDIKVDSKTGKVYFVTLDGVVVYQGDVLEVTENFGDVLVYPNPVVYAQYKGNVKIRGLAAKTNIRITDVAGNLVHQAVARGGSYEWNLANNRGIRVASGIYFVLMTNEDGTDTSTAKIAVVN